MDFTEARDIEWQWHQLGHMQVCTSLQKDNHASTPPLSYLQTVCPSCHPTNSVKALKATHIDAYNKAIVDIRLRPRSSASLAGQFDYMLRCQIRAAPSSHSEYIHLFCVAYSWPLCANMTSSTKPEVHEVSQRRQRRTGLDPPNKLSE